MSKDSQIIKLMESELPSYGFQKRLSYRTSQKEVTYLYKLLNKEVFNNKLPQAELRVMNKTPGYWGYCIAKQFYPYESGESTCLIKLSEKWYCKQWLITTLAHEMVHQYQFDIDGPKRMRKGLEPIMSHGPSFFVFRDKLAKFNISLKTSHSRRRWLLHQNLFKC